MGFDITNLRTDARYRVSPQITATEYPDVDLDRNINRWYQKILSWAIPQQGEWEVNGDILYQDFQANVTDYFIPAALLRIFKLEALYPGAAGFVTVHPKSLQGDDFNVEGNSTRVIDDVNNPTREVFGNILQVKPAPSTTVVNGLKLWAQLSFDDINGTDNKVPNLPEPVKTVLSIGAAADFCLANEMYAKWRELRKEIFGDPAVKDDVGIKGEIEILFANKAGDRRDRMQARRTSFR